MSELDAEWAQRVAAARERARAEGRGDVAEYLALRAANDLARGVGCDWLLATFQEHAGAANRAGARISMTAEDGHRFRVGASTMAGRKLTLRAGVREVSVEAGWPRAPQDGIVRGGGLAAARVAHFGDRARNATLLLVAGGPGAPQWHAVDEETGARTPFTEEHVRRHVAQLQP
ncbi:MAG TPA: hypothetical protein VF546_04820 [Pyrinomonadaceae bacterium]